MICNKCGNEIDKIQYGEGRFTSINKCNCQEGGYVFVLPLDRYELINIKCPDCQGYPFKEKPFRTQHLIEISIRDKSVEEIINEIL